jgi:SAM-dependent methyltransferase
MNIIEKMKKDWDRRADHNAKFWIATEKHENDEFFSGSGEHDTDRILEGLESHIRPSWQVLEIGCGIGRLLRPLASRFDYVCGVDVSQEMIKKSREWLKGINNVETFENTGIDLSLFDRDSFDFVFSYITFQHMPKEVFYNYLPEINRVLKTNGLLKFQMCLGSLDDPPFEDTMTLRVYSEEELSEKLHRNGFEILNKSVISRLPGNAYSNWFILARKRKEQIRNMDLSWAGKNCADHVFPKESSMYFHLALNYANKEKRDLAIDTLKRLVKCNPVYLEAWLELANQLSLEQRFDEAISTMKDMLRANPIFYKGNTYLIKLLKLTGKSDEAVEVFNLLKKQQIEISDALSEAREALS